MKILKMMSRVILLLVLVGTVQVKGPELHEKYLIHKVGKGVVKVLNAAKTGGGTGFHVKLPSGGTAILTNKHVCLGTNKWGIVTINKNNAFYQRRIIDISTTHDLCLIEPIYKDGLSLGSEPETGDHSAILGYPSLTPLRFEVAKFVTRMEVSICTKVEFIFCVETTELDSYLYNAMIQPGNSGSPVVNFFGNLVAVVFAGGSGDHTIAVPLEYVKDFISER